MRTLREISNYIQANESRIVERLEPESIHVYKFLHSEFLKGDVRSNLVFQFVFRSFYRLDNAGLGSEFKREYFHIMEAKRNFQQFNIQEIVQKLYNFKRLKGDNSIQFSFSTKLINMINVNYPIYDSEVARVFGFSTYYIKDNEEKLKRYIEQHDHIQKTYSTILNEKVLDTIIKLFDTKFPENSLSDIKKIDFIFWSTGKLLKM